MDGLYPGPLANLTRETELPGRKVDFDTLQVIIHRYHWASKFVGGKEVLEVCCGPGFGLGLFSLHARNVVGVDITRESLMCAKKQWGSNVGLIQSDAHKLPFKDRCKDIVICIAAVIYLDMPKFLSECYRVLKPGGMLLLNTPNKDQPAFVPSALTRENHSIPEFNSLLRQQHFEAQFFGSFPSETGLLQIRRGLQTIRRTVGFLLRSVGLYTAIRRLMGRDADLHELKNELKDEDLKYVDNISLISLPPDVPNYEYRIIYIMAQKSAAP